VKVQTLIDTKLFVNFFNYLLLFYLFVFYVILFILQIGISCENDRAAIMMAVENYLAEVKMHDSRSPVTASAPFEEASTSDQDYSSTQNVNMVECVICLDLQVSMRFMILCICAFMRTRTYVVSKVG